MRILLNARTLMSALPMIGLLPALAAAQGALPWALSQYPEGGPALSDAVAEPLGLQSDLLVPTCRTLAPGSVQQRASGFAGIGIAIETSPADISEEITERLPLCCPLLIGSDADEKIMLGVAVALEARGLAEEEINAAREVEWIVGFCADETFLRSYEIARGDDSLGKLIAQEGDGGPDTTGSIVPAQTGGGGLPSQN